MLPFACFISAATTPIATPHMTPHVSPRHSPPPQGEMLMNSGMGGGFIRPVPVHASHSGAALASLNDDGLAFPSQLMNFNGLQLHSAPPSLVQSRSSSPPPGNASNQAFVAPVTHAKKGRATPYKCINCGKHFASPSTLNVHRRLHTGELPYACDVCGERFSASTHLKYHQFSHSGEKPHACPTCAKSFKTRSQLNAHVKTHSGEKPFVCDVCNLPFSQRSNLLRHRRSHTHEYRHKCPVENCSCTFTRSDALVTHARQQHSVTLHFCSFPGCFRAFVDQSQQEMHEVLHRSDTQDMEAAIMVRALGGNDAGDGVDDVQN